MNVISTVFSRPACGRDQQAVDILELRVSSGLVQAVRDAPTRQSACKVLFQLDGLLKEADLSDNERRWLGEWLAANSTMLDPEERTGWSHKCGR